jgi:redox-sensitive transcriptional activator oxyR|nr:LysR substrate-binding domain-containing protein [uncultured Capnocytophaga sp.]
MTIVQFQYILAVAQYKNFSIAAEKCFVTQPTLSMQVQRLEEELDVLIFDRAKKPIRVTEIGEKILKQAESIVNESERIKSLIAQHKGFIGGRFRLGIIPTVAPTLLPMFLNNFTRKYPKVELKVEEMTTRECIRELNEGSLDVAIVATPLGEKNLIERPLYDEPFVAYIPNARYHLEENQKIQVSDLNIKDILMLQDGHCFRESVLNICQENGALDKAKNNTIEIKSGSFETLIKLANEGMGMTLLPYLHTLDLNEAEKKNLHYFQEPSPAREISILYHSNELKINIIEALYSVISGVVRGAITFENLNIIDPILKKKIKK